MPATKVTFLKAILSDEKKVLKAENVLKVNVPLYPELSVKDMYKDAMEDPEVAKYLPSIPDLSNKLPEREFFFGVLATIRGEFLKKAIDEANGKRFAVAKDEERKDIILIKDAWLDELTKHPYYSCKVLS